MKNVAVEFRNFTNLEIGDFIYYANEEDKGYACIAGPDNAVTLSGTKAFTWHSRVSLLGGRPALKIKNKCIFVPELRADCIACPQQPSPGDLVATAHGILLCLKGTEHYYFNTDTPKLASHPELSLDDCLVIKSWRLKADLENGSSELFSRV